MLVGLFVLLVIGFLSMVAVGMLAELVAPPFLPDGSPPARRYDPTLVTFLPAVGFGSGLLIAAIGGGRAVYRRRPPGRWLFFPIVLGGISVAVSLYLVFES